MYRLVVYKRDLKSTHTDDETKLLVNLDYDHFCFNPNGQR